MRRAAILIKQLIMLVIIAMLFMSGGAPSQAIAKSSLPYIELVRPDRGRVFAVTWSPDGRYVAVGTDSGLWIYTDTLADVLHIVDAPIHALAWSPDGKTIATGYFGRMGVHNDPGRYTPIISGGLRLYHIQAADQGFTLKPDKKLLADGSVFSLKFNPVSDRLASLSQDSYPDSNDVREVQDVLRLIDLNKLAVTKTFQTGLNRLIQSDIYASGANSLAWSHDGRYLAISRMLLKSEISLTIWDDTNQWFILSPLFTRITGDAMGVAWRNNDTQLVLTLKLVGEDPTFETPNAVCTFHAPLITDCKIEPMALRQTVAGQPNGNLLAYDNGTRLILARTSDNAQIATLDVARDAITMLEWSPDGSKLLFSGNDYAVRIWTKLVSYTAPDPKPIKDVIPLSDSSFIYGNDSNGQPLVQTEGHGINYPNQVNVIDPQTEKIMYSAIFTFYLRNTTISPQGEVYVIDPDNVLWSVRTAKPIMALGSISNHYPYSVIWRPDGQAIATEYDLPLVAPLYNDRYVFTVKAFPSGTTLVQTTGSDQWDYNGLGFGQHFDVQHTVFTINRWSADGRFIALSTYLKPDTGYAGGNILLWDTQTNSFSPTFYAARLSAVGGSGGGAGIVDWSVNNQAMAIVSWDGFYYYHLHWDGNKLIPSLLWTQTTVTLRYVNPFGDINEAVSGGGGASFSPDSRYFLYDGTIYDAVTGWPIFRFRNGLYITASYWHGNRLTVYQTGQANAQFGLSTYEENIYSADHILTYRVSDFLPKS